MNSAFFEDSIGFPNLGITLSHVGRSVRIFGLEIAFYGIIIALAMLCGIYLVLWIAKKTGQDPDVYFDFALIAVFLSVIGARIYYVIFSWDYYGKHPLEILDFRGGGLAIYGGVITGVLVGVVFARRKKIPLLKLLDTSMPGVILGQCIGRWGNFFNREAFGEYTNAVTAMRLPLSAVNEADVTEKMLSNTLMAGDVTCIQVHPTFLYESLWCLAVLSALLAVTFRMKKRKQGTVFLLYLFGYGLGRLWIEGLRTDQLKLAFTGLPVSQMLSLVMVITSAAVLIIRGRRGRQNT